MDTIKTNQTQKIILREIGKNSKITYNELEKKCNKSRRTIIRQTQNLQKQGFLKRIGSRKTGYWKILDIETNNK